MQTPGKEGPVKGRGSSGIKWPGGRGGDHLAEYDSWKVRVQLGSGPIFKGYVSIIVTPYVAMPLDVTIKN